ncbi:MAG: vitamin B12-dependent ribonucleotide reductase, partial [Actinobacteria bacterium]|nr:vitamin B12-dependent ribonucleotide reductase [Actinomycetota bacterium]
ALDYLPFESRSALGIYSAAERARALESGTYTEDEKPQAVAAPVSAPAKKVQEVKIEKAPDSSAGVGSAGVGSSMELFEKMSGSKSDAPLCMTCGVKMRMAGSCFVCEGCGNTSGCS